MHASKTARIYIYNYIIWLASVVLFNVNLI